MKERDLVLRKNEVSRIHPNDKLDPIWDGPRRVIKCNGNRSYRLQEFEGKILTKT